MHYTFTFLNESRKIHQPSCPVAPWPGSVHDSHIFRTSQIQEYLEHHY